MAIIKAKETIVDRVWKETDKRNQARAERIGKLEKMLEDAEEKRGKAEEAYRIAEESLEPEKMIKARQDRDEAGETVEMYKKAIEKAKAENIYTDEELGKIRTDLKMYAVDIIGKSCTGIGEALEKLEDEMNEAMAERDRINDLYRAIFDPQTATFSQVKSPTLENNVRGAIRSARIQNPQYFTRQYVMNSKHILELKN